MAKRTALFCAVLLLVASVFVTGALAMQDSGRISVGERVAVSQDTRAFSFSPPVTGPYAVGFFSETPVSAVLYQGNKAVSQGTGTGALLSAVLNAGEEYTLRLSGAAEGVLEIMRDTLGRSFSQPIDMGEAKQSADKLLVTSGDVHWYAFTAYLDGLATVFSSPYTDSALLVHGILTDAQGNVLQEERAGENGGFVIYAGLSKGQRYYVRISGEEFTTGAYQLTVQQDGKNSIPVEQVTVNPDILTLEVDQRYQLGVTLAPANAHPVVIWSSSDESVVTVSEAGEVLAVGAGSAMVTAKGYGGVTDVCVIEVESVPLSGISFSEGEVEMRVGEKSRLSVNYYPENATNRWVDYTVADETIAEVSRGMLTALREGTTTVTAVSRDGGFTDNFTLTVTAAAPKYRALLVGQQMYIESVNKVRVGSINTTQSMAEMLKNQSIDGVRYETTVALDTTRNETLAAIRDAFQDATANDVSLFYITCHGDYWNGMSYLQFYDGSVLMARDLERALRKIPGTVVVFIDCCGSGGMLGRASSMREFTKGIVSVFSGAVGTGELAMGKYKVLASALLDQDSYRISFDENATEGDMATVFARAICDGAGYSIDRAQRAAMRADQNYDQKITLQELYAYSSRRVMWYLNLAKERSGAETAYVQTVQVYPAGDDFVLFGR